MGSALKKSVLPSEQRRADVARLRRRWRRLQPVLARRRLIFIDETGAATNMVRRYGRAPRGQRVPGEAPYGHWKTTTFIAGLTSDGFIAPLVIDGPMNRVIFTAYVEQMLAPQLRPGDIVVLDNLSSHKNPEARKAVQAVGARLMFLPPYSPDLNPIEMAFAKLKNALRSAAERSRDTLWHRIGQLIDTFKPQECQNYIRHAGYA